MSMTKFDISSTPGGMTVRRATKDGRAEPDEAVVRASGSAFSAARDGVARSASAANRRPVRPPVHGLPAARACGGPGSGPTRSTGLGPCVGPCGAPSGARDSSSGRGRVSVGLSRIVGTSCPHDGGGAFPERSLAHLRQGGGAWRPSGVTKRPNDVARECLRRSRAGLSGLRGGSGQQIAVLADPRRLQGRLPAQGIGQRLRHGLHPGSQLPGQRMPFCGSGCALTGQHAHQRQRVGGRQTRTIDEGHAGVHGRLQAVPIAPRGFDLNRDGLRFERHAVVDQSPPKSRAASGWPSASSQRASRMRAAPR